jgi:hypothetical protein
MLTALLTLRKLNDILDGAFLLRGTPDRSSIDRDFGAVAH